MESIFHYSNLEDGQMRGVGNLVFRVRCCYYEGNQISKNSKCEERSGETAFEALFSISLMLRKTCDQRKDVLVCFIDYQKALDTIRRNIMIPLFREAEVDGRDIRVIQNLYWDQTAEI